MRWLETAPVEERIQFIQDALSDRFTMSELCARYGVSRRIGYKWLARYEEEGRRGLKDRSRAPHQCPHRIDAELAELICTLRRQHPFWGARKLLRILGTRRRQTICGRRTSRVSFAPATGATAIRSRSRISTRGFLLTCHGLLSTQTVTARPVFERAFREYSLPRAIRTDNGVPFATQAIHGLSYLNVWWMRLGIQHQRIHPGRPQQNGAHERMHRTLKRQAIRPVARTCVGQQKSFGRFRVEYNTVRPHEWLNQETPASHYVASPSAYPTRMPPLEYPGHFLVKKVTTGGTFRFQHKLLYIANSLVDQHIGLEETDDGIWSIYFSTVLLATLDERDYIIRG